MNDLRVWITAMLILLLLFVLWCIKIRWIVWCLK